MIRRRYLEDRRPHLRLPLFHFFAEPAQRLIVHDLLDQRIKGVLLLGEMRFEERPDLKNEDFIFPRGVRRDCLQPF